jgi:glutathione reductase (NADPH)
MAKSYDLVVIGTGVAAMVAATRVRAAGWQVAIVDSKPFGGTCALRGCDPKKMLVAGAEAVAAAGRMVGHGVEGELKIDWPGLIAFKRSWTEPIPNRRERSLAESGIDSFHGEARFTGPNSVAVGDLELEARHVLLATGAEPVRLGISGEEHLAIHEDFLAMDKLPPRIVLVGGGYIAAEFSHIAARAGAAVTVLQRGPQLLTNFDPDLVGWLLDNFARIGIDVRLYRDVQSVGEADGAYVVRARTDEGQEEVFEADRVVHAAGRVPALRSLDLERGGVAAENGRLQLNDFLQSVSNPAVYAAGDAAQTGPPLTPVSGHDARIAAANLLNGNHAKPDYRGIPSVAFTIPPIARVGLTEEEAHEQGLGFRVHCEKASDWYTALRVREPTYGFKVLIDEGSDRILGAHLVGPHADEVINIFALAIRHGLTADDLKATMFAYPTGASDISAML